MSCMGTAFRFLVFAQGRAEGFGHHVGDRGFAEHPLNAGGGGIEPSMQRAEVQGVVRIAERAFGDPAGRLNRRDDVEQRERIGRDGEGEPAVEPALRSHQAGSAEDLEDLGKITGGNPGAVGDLLGGQRRSRRRQAQGRPQ